MFTHTAEQIPGHPPFSTPYEVQNANGSFPAVCLVEHARNTIPEWLSGLGLSPAEQQDHIAWDIGIEDVTRRLSDSLGIPSIYCLFSRLIIDVNRPVGHAELILSESDGTLVPGNCNLSQADRDIRRHEIYDIYHAAAAALVQASLNRGVRPFVIGMHSCTPALKGEKPRPWQIGLSTYDSDSQMMKIASLLRSEGLNVGIHEPYDMRKYNGVSLDTHGRARGLPQILVEIRQDLIGNAEGTHAWAKIMEHVLSRFQD